MAFIGKKWFSIIAFVSLLLALGLTILAFFFFGVNEKPISDFKFYSTIAHIWFWCWGLIGWIAVVTNLNLFAFNLGMTKKRTFIPLNIILLFGAVSILMALISITDGTESFSTQRIFHWTFSIASGAILVLATFFFLLFYKRNRRLQIASIVAILITFAFSLYSFLSNDPIWNVTASSQIYFFLVCYIILICVNYIDKGDKNVYER